MGRVEAKGGEKAESKPCLKLVSHPPGRPGPLWSGLPPTTIPLAASGAAGFALFPEVP